MNHRIKYYLESAAMLLVCFVGLSVTLFNPRFFSHYHPGVMTLNGYEHKYFGIGYTHPEGAEYFTNTSLKENEALREQVIKIAGEEKRELCQQLNLHAEMIAYRNEPFFSIAMLRMDFKDTEYKTDVCSGVYFGGWGALLDYYERTPGYELQHVTKININIGDSIYDGLFFQSNVSNFITFYIEKGTMALAVIVEGEDLESIKATIKNQFYEL